MFLKKCRLKPIRDSIFEVLIITSPLIASEAHAQGTKFNYVSPPIYQHPYYGLQYGSYAGELDMSVTITSPSPVPPNYTGPAIVDTNSVEMQAVGTMIFPKGKNLDLECMYFTNGTVTGWQFAGQAYGIGMSTLTQYCLSSGSNTSGNNVFVEKSSLCNFGAGCSNIAGDGAWTVAGQGQSPPSAVNEAAATLSGTPVTINLTVGAKGKPASAAPTVLPTNGTVTGFPGTSVIYTPATNYIGSDTFQFTLSNSGGTSKVATVSVSVTPNPPIAADETASTQKHTPIVIDLSSGASGQPTSASLIGSPKGGTVSGFPGMQVTFTPTGADTSAGGFTFSLANSFGTSNIATSTIWPTLVDSATKATCSGVSVSTDQVSTAFDGAALALESSKFKNVAIDTGVDISVNVLLQFVAKNDQIFGDQLELTNGVADFTKKALKRFTKTNPLSIAMEADSLIFGAVSLIASVCANDPPDPNYTTVALPSKLPIMKTGIAAVDNLEKDYLNYVSLNGATVHAAERWQGATLSNSQAYVALQAAAFRKYSRETTQALGRLNADNKALSSALPAVPMSTFPGGANTMASAFNAQCGKPLPKDLNAALLTLKISQSQIDEAVCKYANYVTASTVSTNFESALAVPLP